MASPNFFIVGAPKCGTTALSAYLSGHPQAFISTPKEPHYFATDLPGYRDVKTLREYERLFTTATPEQTRVGEASVFYMYSRQAARRVRSYAPNARILILVRNPLDLVISYHSQLVYSRDESERDFSKAWRLVRFRKAGMRIPAYCRDHKVLWYDEVARLGEQSERWLRQFGDRCVKFISFDDFVTDTATVYREIVEFLGLDDDHRSEFPRINPRKIQRNDSIANFTERTPPTLVRAAMTAKRILGIRNWRILELLRRWNTKILPPTEPEPRIRQEILDNYEDDILHLGRLMGTNLDHWLQPSIGARQSWLGHPAPAVRCVTK